MCSPGILNVTHLLYVVQLRYYNKVVEGVHSRKRNVIYYACTISYNKRYCKHKIVGDTYYTLQQLTVLMVLHKNKSNILLRVLTVVYCTIPSCAFKGCTYRTCVGKLRVY